jgi:hypothetical protein
MTACPTPEKRQHTKASARRTAAQVGGVRWYHCECGSWHLTSQPAWLERAHRQRLRAIRGDE